MEPEQSPHRQHANFTTPMRLFNSCAVAALLSAGSAVVSSGQSLIGSWLMGDSTTTDSVLVTFIDNDTYYLAHDGVGDGSGMPGMEHGSYSWNSTTGAFTIGSSLITDTTGEWGFSSLGSGATVFVNDSTLTLTPSGEGAEQLTKVPNPTDSLLGSWIFTDGDGAAVVTFLDNDIYFIAEDGTPDGDGTPGMERGTYSFTAGTLTALATKDTNGGWGLSGDSLALTITGDTFSFEEDGETITLTRVGASAIPEPSTYALIASVGALGVAIWRRRSASRKSRC